MEKFKTGSIVAVAAVCLAAAAFPLPRTLPRSGRGYRCLWEEGETEESYLSAMQSFCGIEEGAVLLGREGALGRIPAGEAFETARVTLSEGSLLELYTLDTGGLDPLERAALFRVFGDTLWYSYGAFRFDGNAVRPTDRTAAGRVVLESGSFPSGYLAGTGARDLRIGETATVSAKDFSGSAVRELQAAPPYAAEGGVLYLDTPGGRRLLAGLPYEEVLTIGCDYCDRGALSCCTRLTSLTLPFVGSERGTSGERVGEFRYLFTTGNEVTMPETLTSVTVMGGMLDAYCFYGCGGLRRIDACKVDPLAISTQAFLGAEGLVEVHAPRGDLLLEGEFSRQQAACGCTIYRRIETGSYK